MTPEDFEKLYGKEYSKVYKFTGSVVDSENDMAEITQYFAEAAGTNLVVCTISKILDDYFVWTQFDYGFTDARFEHICDLPVGVV